MIENVIILHFHELALKGKNRSWFERKLVSNIKKHLESLPYKSIKIIYGRIFLTDIDLNLWDKYNSVLRCVIGIRNFILTKCIKLDINDMKEEALAAIVSSGTKGSFRVTSRRQNKNFQYTKQDINTLVGGYIQQETGYDVSLNYPDITVYIEVINKNAYVGVTKTDAFGGLPVGTGESALSLISSGIDSPVASFNIIKRGVDLDYIHFHSSPATSKQSIYNVDSILRLLSKYQLNSKLYLFPLLNIQNAIMDQVPSKYWIIMFRRGMIKISNLVAIENKYRVLVTGDNIGQVASQTLSNIVAIEDASNIPIIRPLCGYNKEDIINQANMIGTYNISIEPYQDCCSYFLPTNPETKAHINRIRMIERKINLDSLIEECMNTIEIKNIRYEYND